MLIKLMIKYHLKAPELLKNLVTHFKIHTHTGHKNTRRHTSDVVRQNREMLTRWKRGEEQKTAKKERTEVENK